MRLPFITTATALLLALTTTENGAWAQDTPENLNIGVFTFISGPAAAYGMPGRNGAEVMIDRLNATGGIGGVPVVATFVDEAQGAEGVISEYRRLSESGEVEFMVAALSSGNCLALAPIADQIEMPTVAWNCDSHQLFKDEREFFFRPNGNTIAEFMAYTLYFLEQNPDVERVAIINPDYSFGHDAAAIVRATLEAVKPGIEIVAELFPKLGSATYQTEISRLSAARPDVIFSNLWGGDLENFVRQAQPRGLFSQSTVVLALGETVLQSTNLPEGVIVGVLGDGWWRSPDAEAIGQAAPFARDYRGRFGEDPVFPSIKMANALLVMKTAYEAAIEANGGTWPTNEDLVAAMAGMRVTTLTGQASLRGDNDGVVDQVVGTTVMVDGVDYPVLGNMVRYDGGTLLPPVGVDPIEWIGTLTPAILDELPDPGSYQ